MTEDAALPGDHANTKIFLVPLLAWWLTEGGAGEALTRLRDAFLNGVGNVRNEALQSFRNLHNELSRVAVQAASNSAKGVDDIVKELGRNYGDLETATKAVGDYLVAQADSYRTQNEKAFNALRMGHFADALWEREIGLLRATEQNAYSAINRSELLRIIGQVSVSYLGPQASAAFAAWLTLKETNDFDLALRTGILVGATSWANSAAAKTTSPSDYVVLKRAVVSGAIGGAAVAAAGGSIEGVKEAALKGGILILVQDGMTAFTGHRPTAAGAKRSPYRLSPTGEAVDEGNYPPAAAYRRDEQGALIKLNGVPLLDTRYLRGEVSAVGTQGFYDELMSPPWHSEHSAFMQAVAKIPGMQAMAIFHDQWTADWLMGRTVSGLTIPPAVYITYIGLGAPFYEHVRLEASKALDRDFAALEHLSGAAQVIDDIPSVEQIPRTRFAPIQVIQSYILRRNKIFEQLVVDETEIAGRKTQWRIILYRRARWNVLCRFATRERALKHGEEVARIKLAEGFNCMRTKVYTTS